MGTHSREQVAVGLPHHHRHGRPGGQARDKHMAWRDGVIGDDLAGHGGNNRRLPAVRLLVFLIVPAPAALNIGATRLRGVKHGETVAVRQPVHAGALGKILG